MFQYFTNTIVTICIARPTMRFGQFTLVQLPRTRSNNFAILPITYSKQCLSITEDSFDLRYLQFMGFREIYA